MSYQRTTGLYFKTTLGTATDFQAGSDFTDAVINALLSAGWTKQQELTGEVSLAVVTITHGVIITIKGTAFGFYFPGETPPGGVGVEILPTDSLAQIVAKFGAAVSQQFDDPDEGITITTTLNGNTITLGGFARTDNAKLCSIFPSGFATWDGATGNQGEGFIHNAGVQLLSAVIGDQALNNHLILIVRYLSLDQGKRVLIQPISILGGDLLDVWFDGLQLDSDTFTFVGSDLQFVIYGNLTTAGSFLVVSNMAPLVDTIDYCHFAAGPIRTNVGPDGGGRSSFAEALAHVWVDVFNKDHTGAAYHMTQGEGTVFQNPDFCFPGYARGIAPVDKLDNKIGQNDLPIKDENGKLLPYEPFVAYCQKDPTVYPTEAVLKIMGQLRDAMIYSESSNPTDSGTIDVDNAEVLISQIGSTARSAASLMIRTSAFTPGP